MRFVNTKVDLQNVDCEVINLTNLYNQELKLANCVDFDGMILLVRKLLAESTDVVLTKMI